MSPSHLQPLHCSDTSPTRVVTTVGYTSTPYALPSWCHVVQDVTNSRCPVLKAVGGTGPRHSRTSTVDGGQISSPDLTLLLVLEHMSRIASKLSFSGDWSLPRYWIALVAQKLLFRRGSSIGLASRVCVGPGETSRGWQYRPAHRNNGDALCGDLTPINVFII